MLLGSSVSGAGEDGVGAMAGRRGHRVGVALAALLIPGLVLVAEQPAAAAPPGTATVLPPPIPGPQVLVGHPNNRSDRLLITPAPGVRRAVLRPDGTLTGLTRLPGAAPGVDDVLVPAQGDVQVGTALVGAATVPFRVDVVTGVETALPAPAGAPSGLRLRGTTGTALVWDTGRNAAPAGGAGLRVQPIGATTLRTLPVPGFNAEGGVLDVTGSNVLVATADSLAQVNLASGAVSTLQYAPVGTGVLAASVNDSDRILYAEYTEVAGSRTVRVRSCSIRRASCAVLLTTDAQLLGLAANRSAFALALRPVLGGPGIVSWGTYPNGGVAARVSGSRQVSDPVLSRLSGALVLQEPTGNVIEKLDDVRGTWSRLAAFPDVAGTFQDGFLDAGALVAMPRQRDFRVQQTQRYRLQDGIQVGTPTVFGPQRTSSNEVFLTGVRSVELLDRSAAVPQVVLRDGGSVSGRVSLPAGSGVFVSSGAYWGSNTTGTSPTLTVRRGTAVVATLPGVVGGLDGPVVVSLQRTLPGVLVVTDLRRPGVSHQMACGAGCRRGGVSGPYLLLRRQNGGTERIEVVEWATGTVRYRSSASPLVDTVRLDGEWLVWGDRTDPATLVAPIRAVRVPFDGSAPSAVQTVVPAGVLLDAHEGRVLWTPSNALGRLQVTPILGTGALDARVRSTVAPASFTPDGDGVADTWAFGADLSGALTSWTLTVRNPAGAVAARLTGAAPFGAVRATWAPPAGTAPGAYTWQLTGATSSGGSVTGPLGEATVRGTVTVG